MQLHNLVAIPLETKAVHTLIKVLKEIYCTPPPGMTSWRKKLFIPIQENILHVCNLTYQNHKYIVFRHQV